MQKWFPLDMSPAHALLKWMGDVQKQFCAAPCRLFVCMRDLPHGLYTNGNEKLVGTINKADPCLYLTPCFAAGPTCHKGSPFHSAMAHVL